MATACAPVDPSGSSPKANPSETTADLPDLLHRIITGYDADPLFASTDMVQKAYARSAAVLTHKGVWMTKGGAVIVPNDPALRRDIVFQAHNTAACGHGGYHATINRLKPCYYWAHGGATFDRYIKEYIRSCASCQVSKASSQKPAGLLNPLAPVTPLAIY